jgi:hypothetical protein
LCTSTRIFLAILILKGIVKNIVHNAQLIIVWYLHYVSMQYACHDVAAIMHWCNANIILVANEITWIHVRMHTCMGSWILWVGLWCVQVLNEAITNTRRDKLCLQKSDSEKQKYISGKKMWFCENFWNSLIWRLNQEPKTRCTIFKCRTLPLDIFAAVKRC